MLAILTIIYYSGIAACGILGAAKYNYKSKLNKISALICGYLCGFAGGIIRDVLYLNTFPIAFTSQCAIDIFIALIAAIFYEHTNEKKYIYNIAIFIDCISVSTFVYIGVDKAILFSKNIVIRIICGFTTALGGGIVSSLFSKKPLKDVITSNIYYRSVVVLGSVFYSSCLSKGLDSIFSKWLLVCYTCIFTPLSYDFTRKAIKQYLIGFLTFSKAYWFYSKNTLILLNNYPYECKPLFKQPRDTYFNNYFSNNIIIISRFIRFHRIRQM